MQFKELEAICTGKLLQLRKDTAVETLVTDSRKAVVSTGSVFFAITGERHDGHGFLAILYQLGIRQFVVEKKDVSTAELPDANILHVQSSVDALQKIARHHRSQFKIPVVGITGSNGKTIVKEWLYQVLSPDLRIIKNPGSYNSQLGVPLSVWQMEAHHQLGIFEAGISRPGEMDRLGAVIQPTIGIFTNLGSAHDEGFSSISEKAQEKAWLFSSCERVICCYDHKTVVDVLRQGKTPLLTWGIGSGADVVIKKKSARDLQVTFKDLSFNLTMPFDDLPSQENALHTVAFMLLNHYKPEVIQDRILFLRSVPMRMELKQGVKGSLVIDDSYNNDLAGLQISLDFLTNQQKSGKTVILSDVLQSGLSDKDLVRKISESLSRSGAKKIIGIGPVFLAHREAFPSATVYKSTEEFLTSLNPDSFADEAILVKGGRPFQFERIVQRLVRKVHGTVMEIDLSAMVHNLNAFKSKLDPGTRVMAMVKAFAYGSGSEEVANLLQFHRVDYLGVAYADEGIDLRKSNITLPIMVMNPSEESFASIMEFGLEPEVYSLRIMYALEKFLAARACKIHLKLDTGMHRLGFQESELEEVIEFLKGKKNITVASIFSHLAGADESIHDNFSKSQAEMFINMADRFEKSTGTKPIRHLLNSPGILRLPDYQFDMVRLGIGLYGVDPTGQASDKLKPVVTLKTVISQIKTIKKGETIGYGRMGKAEKEMTLATLAIGYADGYSRAFSKGIGKFLVNGKFAPVIGNVCMDMTMADVTGIDVKEGEEVIVFGPQLPVSEVAGWIGTIPYELLTSTSERVKRVFFAESI